MGTRARNPRTEPLTGAATWDARSALPTRFRLVWLALAISMAHGVVGPPRPALAQDHGEVSEARALFMAGRVAFEDGRYEAAIAHFKASYELSRLPALLYNLAQCYDRLRRDQEAIATFERYLELDPTVENRASVEARLEALRAAVARNEATPPPREASIEAPIEARDATPAPLAPPVSSEAQRPFPLGPVLTIGGGALVAVTGGVLMLLGNAGGDAVKNAEVGASRAALQNNLDAAELQWGMGQAMAGVGLVAAGAGAVWLWLARREVPSRIDLGLSPRGLSCAGRF